MVQRVITMFERNGNALKSNNTLDYNNNSDIRVLHINPL